MAQKKSFKIILILFLFLSKTSFGKDQEISQNRDFYLKILPNDFVIGSDKAPVIIIEYSTFSCSHCASFHQKVFDEIKKNFIDTNKVRWVSRPFVADAPSMKGSLLATCGTNEKYFLLSKTLFSKQSSWVYNHNYVEILKNIAILSGMKESEFNSCINDKRKQEVLTQQRIVAKQVLEVQGTPMFFVNGTKEQLFSYNDFKNKINSIIENKQQ